MGSCIGLQEGRNNLVRGAREWYQQLSVSALSSSSGTVACVSRLVIVFAGLPRSSDWKGAGVAKLVNAGTSHVPGRKPLWVRIPPPAPTATVLFHVFSVATDLTRE